MAVNWAFNTTSKMFKHHKNQTFVGMVQISRRKDSYFWGMTKNEYAQYLFRQNRRSSTYTINSIFFALSTPREVKIKPHVKTF